MHFIGDFINDNHKITIATLLLINVNF